MARKLDAPELKDLVESEWKRTRCLAADDQHECDRLEARETARLWLSPELRALLEAHRPPRFPF